MIDFSNQNHLYGLETDAARRVNELLQAYSPRLTLRRVPTVDPSFDPQKPFGVYEEGVRADREILSPWVFFLSEHSIDERILARIYENDMLRHGVNATIAKNDALRRAQADAKKKLEDERLAAAQEEAVGLVKLMGRKTTVRHDFGDGNGRVIIGDGAPRSGRTFII